MKHSFVFILFTALFDISQSTENCLYLGNHVEPINIYAVLVSRLIHSEIQKQTIFFFYNTADYRCDSGRCIPFRATEPSEPLPLSTPIAIGVSISVFGIVCLIVAVVYWRHRQIANIKQGVKLSASFSNACKPSRAASSAGFRGRASTSQLSSPEASVSIERSTTAIP
ncbi:unnamed protein product [Adineta ricciae]|uniref:Uncharacterized protein n=1 Tax=Adineta ricciae TaxID=249248 RepID=A0A814TIH1_ADIRI|nr:unnamed protein product [Adineta ricciae]